MDPTSNCNGPIFCEACGITGDEKSDQQSCTCAAHFSAPKPDRKRYWWKTGEELDERGVAPSEVRPTARSRYDYHRPFCKLSDAHPGANVSVDGWSTCGEHFRAPKPDRAIFHWTIGVCLGPYADDPQLCSSDSPEEVSESFDIEPTVLMHRVLDIPALTTNETSDDAAR